MNGMLQFNSSRHCQNMPGLIFLAHIYVPYLKQSKGLINPIQAQILIIH